MDLDYDQKFEEMKKYIPFLDNMIRRLESTTGSGSSNPRQAQLDKIRSLRDLLQDKRKRMKMENLLKCEQVLVNLYAKVEQRDNFSAKSKVADSQSRKNIDLETVRNKLKCVTNVNVVDAETLPEIARSNEMTEVCTPGSKEPALFQRRPSNVSQLPNDSSLINTIESTAISPQSSSRRDYTRVLVSPDTSHRRWVSNETSSNKLFSRRSPKKSSPKTSPKISSPSYYKKERKKFSKNTNQTTESNDLNITLKVPEDSLNSLNTKDILSRIITCSNDDVDIESLRELRTQILGELKQTGAKDDISDLILKSYKTKKSRAKVEVEEGELSDSESEAIESIYGSLVVVDKGKSNIVIENTTEKDQSRKIQICLVINSKEDKKSEQIRKDPQNILDTSDFDLLNENDNIIKDIVEVQKEVHDKINKSSEKSQTNETEYKEQNKEIQNQNKKNDSNDIFSHNNPQKLFKTNVISDKNKKNQKEISVTNVDIEQNTDGNKIKLVKDNVEENLLPRANKSLESQNEDRNAPIAFKANFYKPLVNDEVSHKDIVTTEKFNAQQEDLSQSKQNNGYQKSVTPKKVFDNAFGESKEKDLELPFLNDTCIPDKIIEKDVVSQIDILQALKNEILNENIDIPGSEVSTPPLHQPKLIKVANAQKIIPNRISIEKYKEKTASLTPLFKNNNRLSNSYKEDSIKKQSIKLTEKECERFNFASNIGLDDVNVSSEGEEDKHSDTVDNLYEDLAPKSPDLDDTNDILKTPPIIIPAEPVKAIVVSSKADVDMRTFVPNVITDIRSSNVNLNSSEERKLESSSNEPLLDKNSDKSKVPLLDPRIRRDTIQPVSIEQSLAQPTTADKIPRSASYSNNSISTGNMAPNITPCMTPNLTPNIPPLMNHKITPIMTPNCRTYENTPTHQSFDVEVSTINNKHVYAPSFPVYEFPQIRENSTSKESNSQWDSEIKAGIRKSRWEDKNCTGPYNNDNINKGPLVERFKIDRREDNQRMDCPRTPMPSFGWGDPSNSSNVFNMLDPPMTPSHPFGRPECPMTPSHPFGRLDCPPTPHHLGIIDYPVTPSHPFGRIDCPATPNHPFGDCPPTPSHPFGQLDGSATPSHPFGQLDGSATPSRPFGQLDGSTTPNHPFGQLDGGATPSHSFGRTDYSQNTLHRQISCKDPRLNKNSNYDQSRQPVEKERQYYRDRGFNHGSSYNSHKRPYNTSQSHGKYEREQNIGRNNYNTYYSSDQSGSRYYRESRRESGVTHNTKERDMDRHCNERDNRYNYDKKSSYRDRGTIYRERSIGRFSSIEENDHSRNRSQTVVKNTQNETNVKKTLSIKSHAGRSFIIDTSVNSTFQDLLENKEMHTFDAHRKRASSVGRTLICDANDNRTTSHDSKSKTTSYKQNENSTKNRYTRARSVGRDLGNISSEKSFQDIKADFKRYKSQIDLKLLKNIDNKDSKSIFKSNRSNNKSDNSGSQSRKDSCEAYKDRNSSERKEKTQYFPRKNYRDPRLRGEIDKNTKSNNISRRDKKSSGIVYSNDNIAKGAILRTGFGVKNYKIPKIKRVTTEIDEKELKIDENLDNKKTKQRNDSEDDSDKTNTPSSVTIEPNKIDENSTKRITRSSSKISLSKSVDDDVFVKTRKVKNKKPLMFESESESDDFINEKGCEDNKTMLFQEATEISQNSKSDKNTHKRSELNSVFSLEDLDVFSDNIVSDPVIENINALIADLDNDIDTSKNDLCSGFTEDDTFESMLDIMNNSENVDEVSKKSLHDDVNDIIDKELNNKSKDNNDAKENKQIVANETDESLITKIHEAVSASEENVQKSNDESLNVSHILHENKSQDSKISEDLEDESNLVLKIISSEPIVSTTYADTEYSKITEENNIVTRVDEDNTDGCSTPDSTINFNEATNKIDENEIVPDSTNEQKMDVKSDITNEFNTDVTSTDTSSDLHVKDNIKTCPSGQKKSAIDSIDGLLSILKNKSKIKELVSMLAEKSGENEKIMKKLEKLSEIVSDDEDINTSMESKVYDSVEIEIKCNDTPNVSCPMETSITEPETNDDNGIQTNLDEKMNINIAVTSVNTIESRNSNLDTILNDTVMDKNKEKQNISAEDTNSYADSKKINKLEEQDKMNLNSDTEIGTKKTPPKTKKKIVKKTKRKFMKTNKVNPITPITAASVKTVKDKSKKKPSRELLQLQEDIKEMFVNGEILQSSGIRMCRLAKMFDEKHTQKGDIQDPKPIVVLKKCKEIEKRDNATIEKPTRKKPCPKSKSRDTDNNVTVEQENKPKNKTTSKNKSKNIQKNIDVDPYAFESDSVDTFSINESKDEAENSTDSESQSLNSSQSFGSNELLADLTKNPKRKRRNPAWQSGIIKSKSKKKKNRVDSSKDKELLKSQADIAIPDMECFTDKLYCFDKNISEYSCRLCVYSGSEIIHHYKQQHPHIEIPLSRMNPTIAKEAIEQCKKIDFRVIGNIPSEKYVCRFCYKEFSKGRNVMESFFWHVVSMHTGEYKHNCSECKDASKCSLNLDIPPPPKDVKGQLIGYICKKCNFTQISIENLKRHVIVRHNDEKTEVYKINLAVMPRKLLSSLINQETPESYRVTRSSVSSRHTDDIANERSDDSDHTNNDISSQLGLQDESPERETTSEPEINSKITFETDDHIDDLSNLVNNQLMSNVKQEKDNNSVETENNQSNPENGANTELSLEQNSLHKADASEVSTHSNDIVTCAHFKITYQSSGTKEYVCCINGDNHYKTSLLISMKKHIQTKHTEFWDGYCVICRVIVMSQGYHSFKDCLQHMLDKHMDEFPLLGNPTVTVDSPDIEDELPKSYINVRPLAQLITNTDTPVDTPVSYPKIDSVVSFSNVNIESPSYPIVKKPMQPEKQYKYEDWQVDVMTKKHRIVLETMMTRDKLVQVYKCAGRFCSFTTDNAEGALLHASTHQRIGGENTLLCAYCDFDTSGNAIDLVMHVFKVHGRCQYSCALCFYRAAASQLVGAHVERVHKEKPTPGSVLRTTTVSMAITEDSTNLLSREDAVEYYYCAHGLGGNNPTARCIYKSYLPDKFFEHLGNKHAAPHPCTMCTHKASTAIDLIEHMKSHNMNTYQCTWCVHGADNEFELMMHASIHHPTKQPNAYVRVITSKENASELRILPMASFNKINTPVKDVTSNVTDDPMREAERSLDLEKLIGDIESVTTNALVQSDSPTKEAKNIMQDSLAVETNQNQFNTADNSKTSSTFPDMIESLLRKNTNKVNEEDCVVKSEPEEQRTINDSAEVIYCSDSDDAQSSTIIDLSNDDPVADSSVVDSPVVDSPVETCRKIATELLNKCPKCKDMYRTIVGFKKHIVACWGGLASKSYKCAHFPCNRMLSNVNDVIKHYIKDHKDSTDPTYFCDICNSSLVSLQKAKQHLKYVHKIDNYSVQTTTGQSGTITHTVLEGVNKIPTRSRRKSTSEPSKRRRYGPQDVDKLPITPILDDFVWCSLCEFNTKVRLNMVRHLQLHAEQQPVPHTAPVNPVPHLETNEKHFDKMLNLASSSIATRGLDKRSDTTSVSFLPPETASRYPKYVPERHRYTCGSKGCAYISLSEDMFRFHWETLHSNTNEYHCVHCPPNQQLDTRKPLTATLIIGHLKMHDAMLYACTSCRYYHYKRQIVENHMTSMHGGGQIVVVREDSSTAGTVPAAVTSAPTMDLKPWQCGLCSFKSMLRPEVTEHCSKVHQSKMQYKCTYCPFRTSTLENVTKHQTNSHPDKDQNVFYYYYREGSVPDDVDGTPLWMKQKQKTNSSGPEVKTEVPDTFVQVTPVVPVTPSASAALSVDLNIVKKEINDVDTDSVEELSITDLCRKYGQFCEPNGIMYKCSLCKVVVESDRQAMQSHLYEELKYRRYSCGVCSYKAFHSSGLKEHMASEHSRMLQEPIKLPTNVNIEKWVTQHLEHQANHIKTNEEKIAKQKLTVNRVTAGPSRLVCSREPPPERPKLSVAELENTFGEFGTPSDMRYCCPKCNFSDKHEDAMKEHLENELAKIRWGCNLCSNFYQTYHQAQFHCKSVHAGQAARPTEAARDPQVRADWVAGVIKSQKLLIDLPAPKPNADDDNYSGNGDNSLLVVRYEERVPTPEETMLRKRAAPESDDSIEDEQKQRKEHGNTCQYCDYTSKHKKSLRAHMYAHYGLRPYKCPVCRFMGHRVTVINHIKKSHPETPPVLKSVVLPKGPPTKLTLKRRRTVIYPEEDPEAYMVCLYCEKPVTDEEMDGHTHGDIVPEFAKKGEVVVKCCICLALLLDSKSLQEHHNLNHPDIPINYSFFKIHCESKDTHHCGHCRSHFKYLRDLKTHHNVVHGSLQLSYTTSATLPGLEDDARGKREGEDLASAPAAKKVARKSTTKLPMFNTVARKSTTKLPVMVYSEDSDTEVYPESSYGKKPLPLASYSDVKALMPFCGTVMHFTMQKLTEIIPIEPKVLIKDIKSDSGE